MSDVMKNLHAVAAKNRAADRQKARAKAAQQAATPKATSPSGASNPSATQTQASSGFVSNHDCGPWIEAPNSSRVAEYRYDYGNGQLQVRWTNARGYHGDQTIYQCGDEDTGKGGTNVYRAFAQAVSKGKYVNNVLNDINFWPGDDASFTAPTNPQRAMVRHKL